MNCRKQSAQETGNTIDYSTAASRVSEWSTASGNVHYQQYQRCRCKPFAPSVLTHGLAPRYLWVTNIHRTTCGIPNQHLTFSTLDAVAESRSISSFFYTCSWEVSCAIPCCFRHKHPGLYFSEHLWRNRFAKMSHYGWVEGRLYLGGKQCEYPKRRFPPQSIQVAYPSVNWHTFTLLTIYISTVWNTVQSFWWTFLVVARLHHRYFTRSPSSTIIPACLSQFSRFSLPPPV